jgi:hypothetical protein
MTARLVFLPFLERWNGSQLTINLLLVPRGDPLDPLAPGGPNFPSANFKFDVYLSSGTSSYPVLNPAETPWSTVSPGVVSTAPEVFNALATIYQIDPSPPAVVPPASGAVVMKYLPRTYQTAANYAPGWSDLVVTDDSYLCALKQNLSLPISSLPSASPAIPWGQVIATILRNPEIASAAGLIRTIHITIPSASPQTLATGGYVYVTLSHSSDASALISEPGALDIYASRIPALTAQSSRNIFTPLVFPVAKNVPLIDYDEVFQEVSNYDDGWAKIVHCSQPQQLNPLNEDADGSRPVTELGIRIGWDDEQVTIWMNRQLTQSSMNCPIGISGYRIDARLSGKSNWSSLVAAEGPLMIGNVDLGTIHVELAVETHPVSLNVQTALQYWLPSYFAAWTGPSVVGVDDINVLLTGGPDNRNVAMVKPVSPNIALRYGSSYEFRVRFMDHTGGGSTLSGTPFNPGPSPTASCAFRRWIRPLHPIWVTKVPLAPANDPPASLTLSRPLLGYPPDIIRTQSICLSTTSLEPKHPNVSQAFPIQMWIH